MENDEQPISNDVSLFVQLVAMFQIAARQQMGKMANPVTNQIERDLQHAKASIDTLEMLKAKTKGNLSGVESEFLDKVLFELHMDYVDEVNRAAKEDEEKKEKTAEEKAEEQGGGSTSGHGTGPEPRE
jgi:hypothetical protein